MRRLRLPIVVDDDVREEYWISIRGMPERIADTDAQRWQVVQSKGELWASTAQCHASLSRCSNESMDD